MKIEKTVILSDIHLGLKACNTASLRAVLKPLDIDQIILNGDIIDSPNFSRLTPDQWEIVDLLRDRAISASVKFVRGNHDGEHSPRGFRSGNILPTLLGVSVWSDFPLQVGNRRYLVIHGDQFDPTLNWPIVTDTADWIYRTTQRLSKKAAKHLKRIAKKFGGIVECVKRGAVKEAKKLGCQGVIVGHTHFPDDEWIDGIHYLNCGSWTNGIPSYVLVENEQARLVYASA